MDESQYDLVIDAEKSKKGYLKELWQYRELLMMLSWRNFVARYRQSVVGVGWSMARPIMSMIVFSIIFGKLAKLPSEGNVPYPIMVFAGILPWQFFSLSLTSISSSIVKEKGMISKIYFPRMIVPISAILVTFADFIIAFLIMGVLMAWYGFLPEIRILFLPLFILITICFTVGVGLWFTALNVWYRDIMQMVPFLVQFGTYISPVGYSSSVVPEAWRLIYSLNPMVGVIDGFRWAILGGDVKIFWTGILISVSFSIAALVGGIRYFQKTEQAFADII